MDLEIIIKSRCDTILFRIYLFKTHNFIFRIIDIDPVASRETQP